MKSSPTTTTSYRIIKVPKEWEEPGETIIRTISKPSITAATAIKDQPEWMTDGRLAIAFLINR